MLRFGCSTLPGIFYSFGAQKDKGKPRRRLGNRVKRLLETNLASMRSQVFFLAISNIYVLRIKRLLLIALLNLPVMYSIIVFLEKHIEYVIILKALFVNSSVNASFFALKSVVKHLNGLFSCKSPLVKSMLIFVLKVPLVNSTCCCS